jgi:hypothetical protein
VCDFGSMEFDSREPAANPVFEALFRSRDIEVPVSFYDPGTGRMYGTAGDYWRALGWEYSSYDIDGRFGSLVCDLNVDDLPASERGRYSITMNGGTSEHVFKQYNFFRQVHDVTNVGADVPHRAVPPAPVPRVLPVLAGPPSSTASPSTTATTFSGCGRPGSRSTTPTGLRTRGPSGARSCSSR